MQKEEYLETLRILEHGLLVTEIQNSLNKEEINMIVISNNVIL